MWVVAAGMETAFGDHTIFGEHYSRRFGQALPIPIHAAKTVAKVLEYGSAGQVEHADY
jgi:hypothetical protein